MSSAIKAKVARSRRLGLRGSRFPLVEALESRNLLSAVSLSESEVSLVPVDLRVSEDSSTSSLDEFWVSLDSAPTHNVIVTFTSSDSTDLQLGDDLFDTTYEPSLQLTFTPGDWSTPQIVVIRAENDPHVEGTHSASVNWGASSTDSSFNGLSGSLDAKIFDNDTDGDLLAINEFVNNHEGSDTDEFVELINLNDSSLGPTFVPFYLLQVDGDAGDQGVIDSITVVNAGIPDGSRETFDFNNQIEDGSMTWILVEGLDPDVTVGYDLDADNDGILDFPVPYTTIGGLPQDAVSVDDGDPGDAHYARVVLEPSYDAPQPGSGTAVGGASRIPDGFVPTSGGTLLTSAAIDDRFGWDFGTSGSINGAWDEFTVPVGAPGNFPDAGDFGSGSSSNLTQNTAGAFLTSGNNIYSFSTVTDFDVSINTTSLSGSFTRVVAQWRTLGGELDYGSVLLDGFAPVYTEQLSQAALGGLGGSGIDYLAVWDFAAAPLSSYDLEFTAAGTSLSLDQFQVDAYAQATAFPDPAPLNPFVRNNPFGLPGPATDVVPGLAANTNDSTNQQIPGLLIYESGSSTDVVEGSAAVDSYEVFIGTSPSSTVTVNITADAQQEIAVDTDEDGDFNDETFGLVGSIVFDTSSGGTSRTVFVRAVDDPTLESDPHTGVITHAAVSSDSDYNGSAAFPKLLDNAFGTAGSTVTVSVGDNDGVSATADIGGPYSGDEGTLIALSGAGSSGATLYEWDLDNDGQYDDAAGVNPNFNATDNGVFTIGLRINGVGGPTDSTTVTVNNVAPTASISGTTAIYRGETVTFTLNAVDASPVDQAGLFDFEIDWDGNGSVDETLLGVPDGTTVMHTFPTTFSGNVQVRATDKDAATGSFSQLPIDVTAHVLRDDGFGNTDLIWGGTELLDAVFVFGSGASLSLFVQLENLVTVNRLDAIGPGVTGKIIMHGYGFPDVLVADFATGNSLELHGGDGDDVLVGGFLGDTLYGNAGNDVLLGGTQFIDGADQLFGGEGKDTLFGHWGADTLNGGADEDLLMGDRYAFADIPSAVLTIHNEWVSGRPYAERVTNIQGITNTGVNEDILSTGVTIAEDGDVDTLIGGLGEMDWFLYTFGEDILGDVIEPDEEETDTSL